MTAAGSEYPWLGSRKFWVVAALVVAALFGGFVLALRRIADPAALVPVVSISGPSDGTRGETSRYAVLVRDRFGAPVADAPVKVGFHRNGFKELARARTGGGGDATVEIRFPEDFAEPRSLVAVAEVGVAEGVDDMEVTVRAPGAATAFVSTDKPLYQPGQTVHIRALVMAGEKPVGEKPCVIEIRTPEGIKVFRAEKPTSAFGVVSVDFVLADQVKLGAYQITISMEQPSVHAVRTVEVKRYSLPKLKLALEDLAPFTPDGPLRAKAHATWIFGEPVTKGTVKVTLEQGGATHRAAHGVVDKDGVFAFELPAAAGWKPEKQPRGAFTLRAKLEVEGGITAEATKAVATIGSGEVKLEAFPESGALVPGVPQEVLVVATYEKRGGIEIRAAGEEAGARTSDLGIARLTVKPAFDVRSIDVVGSAPDGASGKIQIATAEGKLVVHAERATLAAGETVKVRVLGAEAEDRVAIRMTRGRQPLATGMCKVAARDLGCEVSLALPDTASGLVWLHALSLPKDRRNVRTGQRMLLVNGGARDLALRATPDKAAYLPRDTGSVAIAVAHQGKPVQAQLGITVADEAVFALADVRPDLEKTFFTVSKDLDTARGWTSYDRSSWGGYRGGYGGGAQIPAPYDVADAYDEAASKDVRAVVLAALTTTTAAGGFATADSSAITERAEQAVTIARKRLGARAILVIFVASMALFAGFGLYAVKRLRRPLPLSPDAEDVDDFRATTRGLVLDWLTVVLAPPVLAVVTALAAELFVGGGEPHAVIVGAWLVLGAFASATLLRSILRVRRTALAEGEPSLGRALTLLPAASFLAHLAMILVLADKGERIGAVLGSWEDGFLVPLLACLAAQVTAGLVSIVRQTRLREVTSTGRVWLLLSRATFLGLPITLFCAVPLVVVHVTNARNRTWRSFSSDRWNLLDRNVSMLSDMKEGGTGARAKGEEGSMGMPAAPAATSAAAKGVATTDKPSQGQAEPARVRDFFPETLLWAPDLVTDEQGQAHVKIPFADSITTWRFGLRAVSKEGQLGSLSIPLVVKQDFFVEASLPPVLTQGDEIAVPVNVFGYTDLAQEVTVEVSGEGISTIGLQRTLVRLGARDTRGVRFTVRAEKAGDRVVRVKASSASREDILERKVLVMPNGLPVVRTTNARVQGAATSGIELPLNAIDGGNDLFVKVYGGPMSQVSEGLDGVFQMPHGCFEQTSSTTYPSILALDFLRRTKAVSPEVERKARAYIVEGFQRLVTFEVTGGGFSLFGRTPASTTLTAYGVLEFEDMARVASVDEGLLSRSREWLHRQRLPTGGWAKPALHDGDRTVPKDDPLVTAYVAWALAAGSTGAKNPDPRLGSVLDTVAKVDGDDPYALALRSLALLAGGRPKDAGPLLDKLAGQAKRTEEGVHWTSKETGVMYSYGPSMDVEVTGLAAHALALAERDPDLRAGALDWIVARRSPRGTWSTTQATIAAMRALLDEARPAPKDPQDVAIAVDGALVETLRIEPKDRDVHRLVSLRRFATPGKHAVELKTTGAGDVSYQLVATHYVPWRAPAGAGLSLDVAYTPVAAPAGTSTACKVRLGWRGKTPATMPLVEIGVPPAFEVDTEKLNQVVNRVTSPVQRYTVERGKVTLYLPTIAEDKPLVLDLELRARHPARVVAPSSAAYLYYEPEVRTETGPVVVRAL